MSSTYELWVTRLPKVSGFISISLSRHPQGQRQGDGPRPALSCDQEALWLGCVQVWLSGSGPITKPNPASLTHFDSPCGRRPLGAQGGEGRNQGGEEKRRAGGIWKTGKENSLHPGLLALHISGKPGHLGSRGAPTSKGCSQQAEKLGRHPSACFFHSMDRLLNYNHLDLWPCNHQENHSAVPCARRTAGERTGPGCTVEQTAEGRGAQQGQTQLYSKDSRSG